MIDLHTHILPGMDDGPQKRHVSLEMLRMEREQGVERVVFTPHFYREQEDVRTFLSRRKEALSRLEEAADRLPVRERIALPRWELGAEVAWMPNLARRDELYELCLGRSRYFLLELPFTPWDTQIIHQLYDLLSQGRFTPVIAHLDRYWNTQRRDQINELLRLGVPIQLSAEVLLKFFSRGKALHMIQQEQVHLLASDCHSRHNRPPNLGPAIHVVTRHLGWKWTRRLCRWAEEVCGEEND